METSEGFHFFSLLDNPKIMAYFVEELLFFKKNENIANWAMRDIFVLFFFFFCMLPPAIRWR